MVIYDHGKSHFQTHPHYAHILKGRGQSLSSGSWYPPAFACTVAVVPPARDRVAPWENHRYPMICKWRYNIKIPSSCTPKLFFLDLSLWRLISIFHTMNMVGDSTTVILRPNLRCVAENLNGSPVEDHSAQRWSAVGTSYAAPGQPDKLLTFTLNKYIWRSSFTICVPSIVFSGAMELSKIPMQKHLCLYRSDNGFESHTVVQKGIHMDRPKSHGTMKT